MNELTAEHEAALASFITEPHGKEALTALMILTGFNDLPPPMGVEQANYTNGAKAVVARILLAYERTAGRQNGTIQDENPLGFR